MKDRRAKIGSEKSAKIDANECTIGHAAIFDYARPQGENALGDANLRCNT
jgi:hypothetical protein